VRFLNETTKSKGAGKGKLPKKTQHTDTAAAEEEEEAGDDSQESDAQASDAKESDSDDDDADSDEALTPPTQPVASPRGATKRTAPLPAAVPSKRTTRASRK
jgi:hypothetical protein